MGCTHSRSPIHADFYTKKIESTNEAPKDAPLFLTSYLDTVVDKINEWPEVSNLQQMYLKVFDEFGDQPMLANREKFDDGTLGDFTWVKYCDVKAICDQIGSALINLNLVPSTEGEKPGESFRFLAIYAKNRAEWLMVDIASILYGITVLPLYDTLGQEAMQHVFEQTCVPTAFCSRENLDKLLKGVSEGQYISLQNIICFDKVSPGKIEQAKALNVRLFNWEEFLELTVEKQEYPELTRDSVFTFNYTSGTTALPKAVVLTHGNVLSAIGGYREIKVKALQNMGPGDIYLSYLPLAHVLERMFCHLLLSKGGAIGFFSGDIRKLKSDITKLKPTLFCAIPRILQRFKDEISKKIGELYGVQKILTDHAVKSKLDSLEDAGSYTHPIYDRLIFSKMREALGGRVKAIFSGGAPLPADLGKFLKVAFACPIIEGYGLTETCGCGFLQRAEDTKTGRCGGPVPCVEITLIDVPEMKYTNQDRDEKGAPTPRGEICIKGPIVFQRYYKQPEKTKEDLDEQGWFHTGDIGQMNPDGSFSIVDRKKNIFKLAQGEYVAPEKIENIYISSDYISEAFVYGDSHESYLVAIIVPEEKALEKVKSQLGVEAGLEELCNNEKVKEFILNEAVKTGKAKGLQGFEQIKKIYLEPKAFAEQGLSTPSMKIKRQEAKEKYKEILKKLYSDR